MPVKVTMLTLYSMPSSGNSYKVRLLFALLDIPFRHVTTEYDGGAELTSTSEFREKNPTGKVPLVEFENGDLLSESNAILHYFAEGTHLVPADKLQRARMYQWMFFEQNMHEGAIAVRSALLTYPHRKKDATEERLAALLKSGHAALQVMETRLQTSPYLAGDGYSIADIALYAYTHSAEEKGGFDLSRYPGIIAWLDRIASHNRHVDIHWPEG